MLTAVPATRAKIVTLPLHISTEPKVRQKQCSDKYNLKVFSYLERKYLVSARISGGFNYRLVGSGEEKW